MLVCANMSGSEKLSLLTIGKFKKPRCFLGVMCLPTVYEANTSAWMTSAIFEEWLRKWDAKLTRHNRKIALFIDNCSAHPRVQGLQSIELIFFPPNTTSEIQPCDQGIIQALKVHYRKNMVKRLITAINSGSTAANATSRSLSWMAFKCYEECGNQSRNPRSATAFAKEALSSPGA